MFDCSRRKVGLVPTVLVWRTPALLGLASPGTPGTRNTTCGCRVKLQFLGVSGALWLVADLHGLATRVTARDAADVSLAPDLEPFSACPCEFDLPTNRCTARVQRTTTNAQSTLERDRALMSIAGLDLSSADIVAWCETSAPTEAPALRTAWQRWRTASAIDDVTAQMSADLREKSRRGMASVGAAARQRLARMGQPAEGLSQSRDHVGQ